MAGEFLRDKFNGKGSKGSTKAPKFAYSNALKHIQSGEITSLLPISNNGEQIDQNKDSIMQYNNNKISEIKYSKPVYTAKGSQVSSDVKVIKKSDADMVQLVRSIVQLLIKLVSNTDQLYKITNLLGEYVSAVGSSDGSEQAKQTAILAKQNLINAMKSGSNSNEPNAQLMKLIEATEMIAKE